MLLSIADRVIDFKKCYRILYIYMFDLNIHWCNIIFQLEGKVDILLNMCAVLI